LGSGRLALLSGTAEGGCPHMSIRTAGIGGEGTRATLYSTFQPVTFTVAFSAPSSLAR
jgi:hypothetical protein